MIGGDGSGGVWWRLVIENSLRIRPTDHGICRNQFHSKFIHRKAKKDKKGNTIELSRPCSCVAKGGWITRGILNRPLPQPLLVFFSSFFVVSIVAEEGSLAKVAVVPKFFTTQELL